MTKYFKQFLALKNPSYPFYAIIFFVTNKCNGKCKGCLYWKKLNDKQYKDLSLDEISSVSEGMGNIYHLLISGGEPFLREDLPQIINMFQKNNKTKHVTIPTNGLLPDTVEKKVEEILDQYDGNLGIGVSIDGKDEENKMLRGVSAMRSIETLKRLRRLRKKEKRLSFSVITRITGESDRDSFERWIRQDFPHIPIRTPIIRGKLKEKISRPDSSQLKEEGKLGLERIRLSFLQSTLEGEPWKIPCIAGSKIGVIESDGDVRLCEMLPVVGNLREDGFNNIWTGKIAEKQRTLIASRECSKGCNHGCFYAPSMLDSPFDTLRYLR